MSNLVTSPCSTPDMDLADVLSSHAAVGFTKFEVFTSWCRSAFDIDRDPAFYVDQGNRHGMQFVSCHLPPVTDDLAKSLPRAVKGARFAEAIGARIVLFKAKTRSDYLAAAPEFLDAIDDLNLTPVLQNHAGSAISTLDDFRGVMEGINDPRMKSLLEVGHFHSVDVAWRDACELLGDSIALIHIKDQIGPQSVPFGTGEIDLPGLFQHMRSVGYSGDYVIEMEVEDKENTLRYLAEAIDHIRDHCQE